MAEKLDAAYEVVTAAGGRTALTLYENDFGPEHCGDGEAEPTPLQFARRYVPAAVAEGLDYVLLSYYPTQCGDVEPGAVTLAGELQELHAVFPNAQLGFGEVGLPRPANRRTLTQARQIMQWAYSLNPQLPYYAGGYFWWYGAQDALRNAPPWRSPRRGLRRRGLGAAPVDLGLGAVVGQHAADAVGHTGRLLAALEFDSEARDHLVPATSDLVHLHDLGVAAQA